MVDKSIKIGDLTGLPVDKIKIDNWNARTLDKEKGIDELAESILEYGLLQPVVVFKEGDSFNLIIGQRRLRAFKELKKRGYTRYKNIPVVILPKKPNEEHIRILSLSENIHRVELNRADIVEVVSYLYKKHKSAKNVAKILGKSIPYIYDHLKIQDAPEEIKQMLVKREINKEDVKRVMEIASEDTGKMIAIAKEMKKLTSPERKRLAEVAKSKPNAKVEELKEEAKKPRIEEKLIVPLTPALRRALDTAVKEIGLSREDVAMKALEDWLNSKGYYKE